MFKFEPGKHREQLDFEPAVLASFEFLRSYELKLMSASSTFVRYESKNVFVNVLHGCGSYEIRVEVGRKDRSAKYGLGYMVSWAGKSAWDAEGFGKSTMFQVSSREGVRQFVPKVAELLKKYGDPFLKGDATFYRQLEEANRRASAQYTRRQHLEDARKEANAAWLKKDFARMVNLYQTFRDELTEIEAKRLLYAEKQTKLSRV